MKKEIKYVISNNKIDVSIFEIDDWENLLEISKYLKMQFHM